MHLVIGSRGSHLALWQAKHIAQALLALGVTTRIEIIKTTGDRMQTASLVQAGGKGLFTKEIEEALLAGSIDLAVHSLKDLPTENPEGLLIAAIPERADARDAMVGRKLDALALGARVGTSSSRRQAQLLALRPDLRVEPVRGNVDTRLRKLHEGQYDAIMLAAAGLNRLGLTHEIAELVAPDQICPAPGQGALAIQTRAGDQAVAMCGRLNDAATAAAVRCERATLSALGGGCQLPIGAHAQVIADTLHLIAGVFAPDGSRAIRHTASGSATCPEDLGYAAADHLREHGAHELLERVYGRALH